MLNGTCTFRDRVRKIHLYPSINAPLHTLMLTLVHIILYSDIGWINLFKQEKKRWSMRLRSRLLGSIGSCSSCSSRGEDRQWGLQQQETISTHEVSQKRIVWASQWLQCTSMHREKPLQEEDESNELRDRIRTKCVFLFYFPTPPIGCAVLGAVFFLLLCFGTWCVPSLLGFFN